MTDDRLIRARWVNGAFHPVGNFQTAWCHDHLEHGEAVDLDVRRQRSGASHRHQFAWVADAWESLPEQYAMEPWAQSPEHLRKYALIRCRFCDTQTFPCASNAEAQRWAANLRPLDAYSLVTVQGNAVYRFTAQSQSMKAMGKEQFEASKRAILEFIADLIGVAPEQLARAA